MTSSPPSQYKRQLAQALAAAARRVDETQTMTEAALEKPRMAAHGDFSCPLPLMLAKPLRRAPMEIAKEMVAALELPSFIRAANVAAPGFINFTLADEAKIGVIAEVFARAGAYGTSPPQARSALVEFVSANPTGPLHVGHGRACAYGDALANILAAAGVTVTREYYVNDAGRQMDILTASVWLRYWNNADVLQKATGEEDARQRLASINNIFFNYGATYRGDYLADAVSALTPRLQETQPPGIGIENDMAAAKDADAAADALIAAAKKNIGGDFYKALREEIGRFMLEHVIKKDMQALGVDTERINFYSEASLHAGGKIAEAIAALQANDALYEKDGALWFRAARYGDEKDRVARRGSGDYTYFAADIAYHADKLSRPRPAGHDYTLINVLGADHHGYVPRLAAAMQALGFAADAMQTEFIQFVALFENGQRLKMSTRAGEFIPLAQLVEKVGADAARFYYLNRKNDQHLDFDITAAKARDKQNPVYYIQYASARIHRVMEKWQGDPAALTQTPAAQLAALAASPAALQLCGALIAYPDAVARAAAEHAPHLLTVHLHETAALLHAFYEEGRILPRPGEPDNPDMTAQLTLLWAARQALDNGAALLGIILPESM